MTVSSTATRWAYTGDNSTVNFAYNNKIFLSADLDVYLDGVLQTETTHYTVSGAGNEGGGTVTFVTPPPTASSVIIVRDMALTQETDIPNGGILLSNALENEFDRSRIADQQINEIAGRALKYPVTDQAVKKYDADGLVIENVADGFAANDAVNRGQMDVAVTAAAGGVLPETILQTVSTLAELQGLDPAGYGGKERRVTGVGIFKSNGTIWEPQGFKVTPKMFGDTAVNPTAAVQAMFDSTFKSLMIDEELSIQSVTLSRDNVLLYGGEKLVAEVDHTGTLVTVSGNGCELYSVEIDGNQDNYTSSIALDGLLITGNNCKLFNVKPHDANGVGLTITGNGGEALACNFDDNAGLGLLSITTHTWKWTSCSFDRNGYGFQKTKINPADVSHDFIAFGTALRFRTHDHLFTNCTANMNGRDGFNVNQGTYRITFDTCIAQHNDDGGFTLAADSTDVTKPGDGEGCWEIDYLNCIGYNNYTGGLAAYQSMHNIKVRGGRYFNNSRVLGSQSTASSYNNGVFFAGGSTGIDVDTQVYDDRQEIAITAVAGGGATLTAVGWEASKDYYPKVAIHQADGTFRGYGIITSESTDTVVISSAPFNGVTLGSIIAGDRVTQKVQSNGVFCDNGCIGEIRAQGFGFRKGAGVAFGRKVYSSHFAAGQNIKLRDEDITSGNLITNPGFDVDLAGWTINTPGGGSSVRDTTIVKSLGSLKIIAGTSNAEADPTQVTSSVNYFADQFVTFSGWVYCTSKGGALLRLFVQNGGSFFNTDVEHKGQGWEYLTVGAYAGNQSLIPRFVVLANQTAYLDDVSLESITERWSAEPARITRIFD